MYCVVLCCVVIVLYCIVLYCIVFNMASNINVSKPKGSKLKKEIEYSNIDIIPKEYNMPGCEIHVNNNVNSNVNSNVDNNNNVDNNSNLYIEPIKNRKYYSSYYTRHNTKATIYI